MVRRSLAVLFALAAAAPAAAAPPLPPGDYALTVAAGGVPREYMLHVPAANDGTRAMPLVLVFHGSFGNASNIAEKTGFNAIADREGFLAAYPQAAGIQWNDGRDDSATRPPVDDVAFAAAVVHQVALLAPLDRRRVYATGLSSGGMLAYRLGIELDRDIAAIAPVAAVLDEAVAGAPRSPVALVAFHGTDDETVAYDGRAGPEEGEGQLRRLIVGGAHPSVPASVGRWAQFNGCAATPAVRTLADADPGDGTTVDHLAWAPCATGADVELFRVNGGGHSWPDDQGGLSGGGVTSSGAITRDISASEEIWRFFAAHPKR